jgi:hypothetical protein
MADAPATVQPSDDPPLSDDPLGPPSVVDPPLDELDGSLDDLPAEAPAEPSPSDLPVDEAPASDDTPEPPLIDLPVPPSAGSPEDTRDRWGASPAEEPSEDVEVPSLPELQKQPLAEELPETEPNIPAAIVEPPLALMDTNVSKRRVDQRMVMVDDAGQEWSSISDTMVLVAESPTDPARVGASPTTEHQDPTTAPTADDPNEPASRIAMRAEPATTVSAAPSAGEVEQVTPAPANTDAVNVTLPSETDSSATRDALPSFRIAAVPPPKPAATPKRVERPDSTPATASVRFVSEGSSLRVGSRPKSDASRHLRFRR